MSDDGENTNTKLIFPGSEYYKKRNNLLKARLEKRYQDLTLLCEKQKMITKHLKDEVRQQELKEAEAREKLSKMFDAAEKIQTLLASDPEKIKKDLLTLKPQEILEKYTE